MPKYLQGVGANAIKFSYNGVDLSTMVRSVSISQEWDKVEVTGMNAIDKEYMPGLRDSNVEVEFYQNFETGSVDQTLYPLGGSGAGATMLFQTNGGTVTTQNPKYTMVATYFTYQPVDGEVGAPSMTRVTFSPAPGSSLTRGTV